MDEDVKTACWRIYHAGLANFLTAVAICYLCGAAGLDAWFLWVFGLGINALGFHVQANWHRRLDRELAEAVS